MKRIDSAVQAYQDNLRIYLNEELRLNGGTYKKWYDDLASFREYMKKHYIALHINKEFYVYKRQTNKQGDRIDHHCIAYLAPMNFVRTGFNGNKLTPPQQIEKLAHWIEAGGGQIYLC